LKEKSGVIELAKAPEKKRRRQVLAGKVFFAGTHRKGEGGADVYRTVCRNERKRNPGWRLSSETEKVCPNSYVYSGESVFLPQMFDG